MPAHRLLPMQEAYDGVSPGSKINPYPLYHLPMMSVFPLCLSAPGVGVAKGAVARYIDMMERFTTKGRGQSVADFQNSQIRLAEASALVDSAELLLQRDVRETMGIRASGRQLTNEERVRNRRDHAWAAETSVRAVDLLYKMTGGAGLHDGNALLRSFRDAHAIGMHLGNNWDVAGPLTARSCSAVRRPGASSRRRHERKSDGCRCGRRYRGALPRFGAPQARCHGPRVRSDRRN